MLKMLYLYIGNYKSVSLNHKIVPVLNSLNKVGIKTTGLFFSENIDKKYFDGKNNIWFIPINYNKVPQIFKVGKLWFIGIFFKRKVLYKTILKALIEIDDFNYAYMRYNHSDYSFYRFVKKFPKKIITEHNTNELFELKNHLKNSKNPYWKYQYYCDKFFAPKTFPYLACITGVTNEIAKFELDRSNYPKPKTYTLSNGINVNSLNRKKYTPFDGRNINILFLSGKNSIWHGIERIFYGLANYNAIYKINIYIVGNISDNNIDLAIKLNVFNSIKLITHKLNAELDHYFDICHLAIGSIGLFKNNLSEGSVLKVRQYLARGIPFIIGYIDTDLINEEEIMPYYLQIPNNEEAMDFNAVCDFAIQVLNDPLHPQKIRAFAEKKIDFSVKINLFKQFLHELNQ